MTRPVLLIDIGGDSLPAVTPVNRVPGRWAPPFKAPVEIPPVVVEVTPAVDTITITWEASPLPGAVYYLWRAPDVSGAPGVWGFVTRTTETRYTYTDTSGAISWWKVTVEVNGVASEDSNVLPMEPVAAATLAQLAHEAYERFTADSDIAAQASQDATNKANAALAAAIAHADVIGAQVADITGADTWSEIRIYPSGDLVKLDGKLYRALQDVPNGTPVTDTAYWQLIGNYTSLGEAVASSVSMSTKNASDLAAEAAQLDAVQARMPAGAGQLATQAAVQEEVSARATAVEGVANRTAVVEARMPTGTDKLANEARVIIAEQASVGRDIALGQRVDGVAASLVSSPNMLADPGYAQGFRYWSQPAGGAINNEPKYGNYLTVTDINGGTASEQFVSTGQGVYVYSFEVYRNSAAGNVRVELGAYSAAGLIGSDTRFSNTTVIGAWQRIYVALAAPANTNRLQCRAIWEGTTASASVRRHKLELGLVPTVWSDETGTNLLATATQLLDSRAATLENGQQQLSASYSALSQTVSGKAETSALNTLGSRVDQQGTTLSANSAAISQVNLKLGARPNLLPNGGFELGSWSPAFSVSDNPAGWGRCILHANPGSINGGGQAIASPRFAVVANDRLTVSFDSVMFATAGQVSADVEFFNSTGTFISGSSRIGMRVGTHDFQDGDASRQARAGTVTVPQGAVTADVRMIWENVTGCTALGFRRVKVEKGELPATAYTTESAVQQTASATQSLSVRTTQLENGQQQLYASWNVALTVDGYSTGFTSFNNGTTSGFNVLASAINFVDPNDRSSLFNYQNGNLTLSGVLRASLLQSSALEIGSTRIHTGGGRMAPFTIQDVSFASINGSGWQDFTQTCSGFVGPANGSGYNGKRFAAQRMDVFLDVLCAGSRNSETVVLEVQYNGGGWSTIQSVNMDVSNKAMIPLLVRYTTLDSWDTVAFRARTTGGNSQALSLKVNVQNYNASANAAGSSSGTQSGGSGGGTTPTNPTQPGDCVDFETTVLPDGRYVRDLVPGVDKAECVNVLTGEREFVTLLAMGFGFEDCSIVTTAHGEVIQSQSTPMDMRDGSIVRTPDLAGKELLSRSHGWEVASVRFIGPRKVCKPDFGNRMFFAGTRADRTLATHNIRWKDPSQP